MIAAFMLATLPQVPAHACDRWTAEAERIAVGRVARVVELDSPLAGVKRILAVHVQERLVGPPEESVLYVAETSPRHAPGERQRGLFFLRPWEGRTSGARVPGLPSGTTLWVPLSGWSRMQGDRPALHVPQWLHEELASAGEGLELEALRAHVETSIARCLPEIRARLTVHGPGWSLRLGPDRAIHEGQSVTGTLSAEAWDELLALFERSAFAGMPDDLGSSRGPDQPGEAIELRTRDGRHVVRIEAVPPGASDLAEAWRRARSLWEALPGAGKPPLPPVRERAQ